MLDVHPPHAAVHTWKDFIIHVGTITVGLLIAVGLEQTVEFFHHRHEAHHARELLATEIALNDKAQQQNQYVLAMHEQFLFNDLAVISRLRLHTLAPDDHIVLFHPNVAFAHSAWLTAQQSGSIAYLNYDETQRYADIYAIQDDYDKFADESITALQNANTMFYQSSADRFDPNRAANIADTYGENGDTAAHAAFLNQAPGPDKLLRFTPAQVDRLEQTIQQAIYQDERLVNRCKWLHARYIKFTPE